VTAQTVTLQTKLTEYEISVLACHGIILQQWVCVILSIMIIEANAVGT